MQYVGKEALREQLAKFQGAELTGSLATLQDVQYAIKTARHICSSEVFNTFTSLISLITVILPIVISVSKDTLLIDSLAC